MAVCDEGREINGQLACRLFLPGMSTMPWALWIHFVSYRTRKMCKRGVSEARSHDMQLPTQLHCSEAGTLDQPQG